MNTVSWTRLLREYGDQLLLWMNENSILESRAQSLVTALRHLLFQTVETPEAAAVVWKAAPAVLTRCNEQSTCELPFAPIAYMWLHLLDRYARTWRALEVLVQNRCLPLAKYGVRTLDVGTGPGPAAFAVHDFYQALVEFSVATGLEEFNQPPEIDCVEYDKGTNHLRHHLAELVYEAAAEADHTSVLGLCRAQPDFHTVLPSQDRIAAFESIQRQEDRYFDEFLGEWVEDPRYSIEEANQIAQSLYRYRLFVFSNFLTTVGTVTTFEANITDLLNDAGLGSIMLVLGGKRGEYPAIYEYVDQLADSCGFTRRVEDVTVSSTETVLSDLIYEEGQRFYKHLQSLSPNRDEILEDVHQHFGGSRSPAPTSGVRAYRKNNHRAAAFHHRLPAIHDTH